MSSNRFCFIESLFQLLRLFLFAVGAKLSDSFSRSPSSPVILIKQNRRGAVRWSLFQHRQNFSIIFADVLVNPPMIRVRFYGSQ